MARTRPIALILLFAGSLAAAEAVRVAVVDPQGAAVPGALVMVGAAGPRAAGPDGILEAQVEPPVEIRAVAPGFAPGALRVEAGTQGTLEIRLRPETVYSTVDVVVRREELAPGPVVTSAVEIEQSGARTVFDAVDRLVPSAFVTRRGVMGYGIATNGTGMVTVRGVGSSPNTGVLVVVDGRPDYMGLMGHPLPDFYSLTDAASVSVTKGPASVLYGTNAMGGAINIKQAQPVEGFHSELSASQGSYWTGQYRLKHGGGFPKWFYHLTAGVDHTNGDRPVSHFRNQDGTFATGYSISDRWKTSLNGRYGHFVVEDPGPVGRPPGYWASVGRGGFNWNLDNSGNRVWGGTRVFSSWGHHHIADGWRSNDRTTGARVHQNILINSMLLADGGADFVDYGGQGRNVLTRIDYGEHSGRSAAGFGRLHFTPLARLRLNAGVRYEHNSIFGGVTVPEAGASIGLAEGYALDFAVARGFRNPTIRELYLFPAPNPDLQPEHMWNYQASLRLQPNRRLAASLTGYYADLENMIAVTGRFPNIKLLNAGRALNRGLEGDLRWRITDRLSFTGGYAYLRSTNLAPYIPGHKGTYGMELRLSRLFLYCGGVTVGSRWADAAKRTELAGYTAPALKLMLPIGERWTLFGMVDNFVNAEYQVVTGYPMPKVNASGGFSVRF